MLDLDSSSESLLRDPQYLLSLYSRISQRLTVVSADGTRTMLPSFESVDSRYRVKGQRVALEELRSIARSAFPTAVLTDREIPVLLHMLPVMEEAEEMGSADPIDFLTALRQIVPQSAWQVWLLVRRARTVIFKETLITDFEQSISDLVCGRPAPPVSSRDVYEFLVGTCALSGSEANIILQYCHESDWLDAELLHQLLFEDSIPGKAEYPILAAQLAQATTSGSVTGSMAMLNALSSVVSTAVLTALGAPDFDFGDLVDATLTGREFYSLCRLLAAGFEQEQSDQLYYYLKDSAAPLLRVGSVVQMYRDYFPPVTPSVLQLIQGAVRRYLINAGGHVAFLNLYFRLEKSGTSRIPIGMYVRVLRDSGVPDVVPDLTLEWLRLKGPTRIDLLLFLCVPVSPSREAIIRKLFERLDTTAAGQVHCEHLLASFQPHRVEGEVVRRKAVLWLDGLKHYVAEIDDDDQQSFTYELFFFFWSMVSAAVDDDPTFTMVIWQAFGLGENKRMR